MTTADRDQLVRQFIATGVVHFRGAFPREVAEEWVQEFLARTGIDESDPATFPAATGRAETTRTMPLRELAPDAWQLICDLLGGDEEIDPRTNFAHNGFNANYKLHADQPWQPPSAESPGWHKDGWFFKHFLDSPEQALLCLVIWRDILPRSGGTFYAPDSVPLIARDLVEHPEGCWPDYPWGKFIQQCHDFREVTAAAGDLVILHPFTLHAASNNPSGRIRLMNNKVISVSKPLQFNRADGSYTPLERSILNALGVDRLDFEITGVRERDDGFGPLQRRAS